MFLTRTTYLIALVLAGVFAYAGAMKLRDRAATTETFRDLGLPCPRLMAVGVPILELGIAAGLVVAPGVSAPATIVVLAFFTTLLAGRLRSGVAVNCGCFGQASVQPLSRTDIYRNLALILGAVLASFASPTLPGPVHVAAAALAVGIASISIARTRARTPAFT
ncbi:MAG: DoxX family membrane protein [Actinomycetia bacterium]|nr:DoxX family membrane protein [Actinomycetes bacterium]